jgi:ABC-type glycerol-3-phosphate transport system permease component
VAKRGAVAKILAIAGTVLVWLPLLAPLVFAVAASLQQRGFLFDYLMPAELFPVVLAGGLMLVSGSLLARSRRRFVIASLAVAVVLLVGVQAFAAVTGMASGRIEATGWRWAVVLSGIIGYALAVTVLGVGGALLARDLFRSPQPAG